MHCDPSSEEVPRVRPASRPVCRFSGTPPLPGAKSKVDGASEVAPRLKSKAGLAESLVSILSTRVETRNL